MTDMILFSPSTCGAYSPLINGQHIPDDVVELPLSQWQAVLAELAISPKKIGSGVDGFPILLDPPLPDAAQFASEERVWRDAQLFPSDAIVSRHRDELESGGVTTLTVTQYAELQLYRRQLRDWPQGAEFPLTDHRPVAPTWLSTQLQ